MKHKHINLNLFEASQSTHSPSFSPGPMVSQYHMRWMIKRDLPKVLFIEGSSFPTPWNSEEFIRHLRQHNRIAMVVEDTGCDNCIVGFVVFVLHRSLLEIINIAVHPDHRRRGIGSMMLTKISHKLSVNRRPRAEIIVRETNLRTHIWLRSNHWVCHELRRDWFEINPVFEPVAPSTFEDGYVFRRSVT